MIPLTNLRLIHYFQVHSLVTEGLSDTQIVQLLGWINSYQ